MAVAEILHSPLREVYGEQPLCEHGGRASPFLCFQIQVQLILMKSLNAVLTALQGYHRLTLSKWDSVTAGRLGSALSSPSGMCYHCCEVSSERRVHVRP